LQVPGTWWKGASEVVKKKKYTCKVVRYTAKYWWKDGLAKRTSANSTAPAWFITVDDEGPNEYLMCWMDVCSFLSKKDRPVDVSALDESELHADVGSSATEPLSTPPRNEQPNARTGGGRRKALKNLTKTDLDRDLEELERANYTEGEKDAWGWVFSAHGVKTEGDRHKAPDSSKWKDAPERAEQRKPFAGESEELKLKHHPTEAQFKKKGGWTVLDSFLLAYSGDARECVITNTNLYAELEINSGRKKDWAGTRSKKWKPATDRSLAGYLAVLIFMSLVGLPEMRDYWHTTADQVNCPALRAIMSRNDFDLWRRFVYFADPRHKVGRGDYTKDPPPGYDIMHNWRPMQEHNNKAWLSLVHPTKWLTFDEMMIKCAMKTKLSRRQPNKPIRDGIQSYAVCASKGEYCYIQWIDIGASYAASDPNFRHVMYFGWMVEMVIHVILNLGLEIRGNYHVMVFDQAFSSPLLFLVLLAAGVYSVGTIQKDKRGYPADRLDAKGVLVEGAMHFMFSPAMQGLTAVAWFDKSVVTFLSSYHYAASIIQYLKKKKGCREATDITQPLVRKDYNERNINGVDLIDQKGSSRLVDRRSKKTIWHRVHQHSLTTCITNALAHFELVVRAYPEHFSRQVREEAAGKKGGRTPKRWRWRLFHLLAAYSQDTEPVEEGGGADHTSGKVKHTLRKAKKKGRCAREGCNGQPTYGCENCDRLFCLTKCWNKHSSGKCKHKTRYAKEKREWESESEDEDEDDEDGSEGIDESESESESESGSGSESEGESD
jgi:hypothetical protein